MRSLKRWFRLNYAEYRIRDRQNEISAELSALAGNKVYFERSGSRGQDSIYIVRSKRQKIGVLRLYNPWRKKKTIEPSMPYILLPPVSRLLREWNAYQLGSAHGLTPTPVWRCHDAILCDYIPWRTLHYRLLANAEEFWLLVIQASLRLGKLHKLGLTHMDASLANILADDELINIKFIDFEFAPSGRLSVDQQQVYDYLRLLESSLKFMPPGCNKKTEDWITLLIKVMSGFTDTVDIRPLLPALPRLVADPYIWPLVQNLFQYKNN
jgi:serine/threonine protein kinase